MKANRKSARLIGGAGTGKTRECLEIMVKVGESGIDIMRVCFVSFTRAARREAASRASDRFGVPISTIEKEGWFRTLHSVAYRCLGVSKDQMLTDDKASREWAEAKLQATVNGAAFGDDEIEERNTSEGFGRNSPASVALMLWGVARNRMEPLAAAYKRAERIDPDKLPGYGYCERIVEQYEEAKRQDERIDFTDLLSLFAGYDFAPEGSTKIKPICDVPHLPVLMHDECQDASALSMEVFKRLCDNPAALWVYIAGDPWQNLYAFGGSDHKHFLNFPVDKQKYMPKSWRCGAKVLGLGERVLKRHEGYFDRGIAPADHETLLEALSRTIHGMVTNPAEEWLILARTNRQAGELSAVLDKQSMPWKSTRGRAGYAAPVRMEAFAALKNLEDGGPVSGKEWRSVLEFLPSSKKGDEPEEYLERGTKTRFKSDAECEKYVWIMPSELGELGATEALQHAIASGHWPKIVKSHEGQAEGIRKWGAKAAGGTRILVGTVHSAKGMESDNVCLLRASSYPCANAARRSRDAYCEEVRVAYVGVTRARKRLILFDDGHQFRLPIPA